MPKAKPTPLSEALLPVKKGTAVPAPEPGRRREAPQDRVAMTFRITTDAYETLRRLAFETRCSQHALVDEALELLTDKHGVKPDHKHGRTAA